MRRSLAILALLAAMPGRAQDALPPLSLGGGEARPNAAGRLLVIDRERVLAESALGRTLRAELDQEGQALAAENREIEARLRAEESALTERRAEMEPSAFRAEAEAFDARVQEIRAEQGAKQRDILGRREELQVEFWDEAVPIIAGVLRERGAVVLLDRDTVFLSSDSADITDEVIARLDVLSEPPPANPSPAPEAEAQPPDALVIAPPEAEVPPPGAEGPAAE